MLQRTLSRQGEQSSRRRLKPILMASAAVVVSVLLYMLLPEPRQRVRPVALDSEQLRVVAASLYAAQPAGGDRTQKDRAALGRKLFSDSRLSANGAVACSTCHNPERAFTDGLPQSVGLLPTSKNSGSVVNAHLGHWFYWDGRVDSLEAQALVPIEDPREHAVSRTFVVEKLRQHYAADYTKAFGPFPEALAGPLPENALPAPPKVDLAIDVAAYALATLGSFDVLSDVLDTAQKTRLAPAMELSRRATRPPNGDDETQVVARATWHAAWGAMPPARQQAINEVFANFGRAIAAFESGLTAVDSPFDRFAARLTPGTEPETVLDQDFGARELAGLKIFAGPGRCTLCHAGPAMSDQQFHNIGLAQREDAAAFDVDVGRAAGVLQVLQDPFNCKGTLLPQPPDAESESCRELGFLDATNKELVGAFKTPSLRNVALTAPYMHDGRFATLRDVIQHYDELEGKPAVGHREESLQPLDLSEEETEALEAFLIALSSPIRDVNLEERVGTK